jgi:hypothetical protein
MAVATITVDPIDTSFILFCGEDRIREKIFRADSHSSASLDSGNVAMRGSVGRNI